MKGKIRPSILVAAILAAMLLFWGILVVLTELLKEKTPDEPTAQNTSVTTESTTSATTEQTSTQEETTTETTAETTDSNAAKHAPIYLTGGDNSSPYAKTIVFNHGTPDENTKLGFFVMPRTYILSNITNKPIQYNIYSDEMKKNGKFDEPAHSESGSLQAYESASITINDGYYIYLANGDSVRLLVKE